MIGLWFSWFLHTRQVPLGTPLGIQPSENAIRVIFLCIYIILILILGLSGGKAPPPLRKLRVIEYYRVIL